MSGHCKACRWFDPTDEEALSGLCRLAPPKMQGEIAPHGDAQFQNPQWAIWPEVSADDWCGSHEDAPPSPPRPQGDA